MPYPRIGSHDVERGSYDAGGQTFRSRSSLPSWRSSPSFQRRWPRRAARPTELRPTITGKANRTITRTMAPGTTRSYFRDFLAGDFFPADFFSADFCAARGL